MDRHGIDHSHPELARYFSSMFPEVEEYERDTRKSVLCTFLQEDGTCTKKTGPCTYSHHPCSYYYQYSKDFNCGMWAKSTYLRKWVLKFCYLRDPEHMALRVAVLENLRAIRNTLPPEMEGYFRKMDQLIQAVSNSARVAPPLLVRVPPAIHIVPAPASASASLPVVPPPATEEEFLSQAVASVMKISAHQTPEMHVLCNQSDSGRTQTASTGSAPISAPAPPFAGPTGSRAFVPADRVYVAQPSSSASFGTAGSSVPATTLAEAKIRVAQIAMTAAGVVPREVNAGDIVPPAVPAVSGHPAAGVLSSELRAGKATEVAHAVVPYRTAGVPANASSLPSHDLADIYKNFVMLSASEADNMEQCLCGKVPALFQCADAACKGNNLRCETCIEDHSRKIRYRTHRIWALCADCFNYKDLARCTDCRVEESILCSECHVLNHDKGRKKHPFRPDEEFHCRLATPGGQGAARASPVRTNDQAASNSPSLTEFTVGAATAPATSVTPALGRLISPAVQIPSIDDPLQRKLDNARVRILLEDVVHPLLEVALQVTWHCNHDWCPGCGVRHLMNSDAFQLYPCVQSLLPPSSHNAARIAYNLQTSAKVTHFNKMAFDVTAMINLLQTYCKVTGCVCLLDSVTEAQLLKDWRNATFHPSELASGQRKLAFDAIQTVCNSMIANMNAKMKGKPILWYSVWLDGYNLADEIVACEKRCNRLDIEEYQRSEIMKECRRAELNSIQACLGAAQRSVPSLERAQQLCNTHTSNLLIIPRFEQQPNMDALRFLAKLPWAVIIDLNEVHLWNTESSKEDFRSKQVHFERATDGTYSSFGSTNLLYTSCFNEHATALVSHFCGKRLQVFVLAAGLFSHEEEDLDNLKRCLHNIQEHCEFTGNAIEHTVIPIFEDPADLMTGTRFLWMKKYKKYLSHDEQRQMAVDYACFLYIVEGWTIAHYRHPNACVVRGTNKTPFCLDQRVVSQVHDRVEILTVTCDDCPLPNILESNNDRGRADETEEAFSRHTCLEQLREFVSFRQPATWFMFKCDAVVRRTQLPELVTKLQTMRSSVVTLVHNVGQGGTTFARHALYELRNEGYVCLVVSKLLPFQMLSSLLMEIQSKMQKLLPGIIILFDMNRFPASELKLVDELISKLGSFRECEVTILVITTGKMQSLAQRDPPKGICVLKDGLDDAEQVKHEDLLRLVRETQPKIIVGNVEFPVKSSGLLDVAAIKSDQHMYSIVKNTPNQILIKAGFMLCDLVSLKKRPQVGTGASSTPSSTAWVTAKERRIPFFGALAFSQAYGNTELLPQFKDMLDNMSPEEINVLQLCVFYAIFTGHLKVPGSLASLFYHQGKIVDRRFELPCESGLSSLIEVDECNDLSIYTTHLAYLLAGLDMLFGRTRPSEPVISDKLSISVESLRRFINEKFLPFICEWHNVITEESLSSPTNSPQQESVAQMKPRRRDILSCAAAGLRDAFCEFNIWHPGEIPLKNEGNGKDNVPEMHNSFLLEALLKTRKVRWTFPIIKCWFLTLLYSFRGLDDVRATFATHASRYFAYVAMVRKDFSLIEEAKALLEPADTVYKVDTIMCDARGNVFKREVLIYKYLLVDIRIDPRRVTDINYIDEDEAIGRLDDGAEITKTGHPVSAAGAGDNIRKDYDTIVKIKKLADDGYYWFERAAEATQYCHPFPMVAAVQIMVAYLECLRSIVVPDVTNYKTFVQLQVGKADLLPRTDKRLIGLLSGVKAIAESTLMMITYARNSNMRSRDSGRYEHSHRLATTSKYIDENERRLKKLTVLEAEIGYKVVPIQFDIVGAKNLFVKGNRRSTPEIAAQAWCIVTCLLSISSAKYIGETGSEKPQRDLSYFHTLWTLFISSTVLAGHHFMEEKAPLEELQKCVEEAKRAHPREADILDRNEYLRDEIAEWARKCSRITNPSASQNTSSSSANQTSPSFGVAFRHDYFGSATEAAENRSFAFHDCYLCGVMVSIWHVLRDSPASSTFADNVRMLEESNKVCFAKSEMLPNASVPRLFLVNNSLMPGNPFCSFIFIEQTDIHEKREEFRNEPVKRELLYRWAEYEGKLRVLLGTVEERPFGSATKLRIRCSDLGILLGIDSAVLPSLQLYSGDNVSFVVGLTDRGMRAYGVQKE
jgi:hypothetical protein